MTHRGKIWLGATVCLFLIALLAGLGWLLFQRSHGRWFSDPQAIRPWSEYDALMQPPPPSSIPWKPVPAQGVTWARTAPNLWRLSLPNPTPGAGPKLNWTVVRADSNLVATVAGSDVSVRLAALATAWWMEPPEPNRRGVWGFKQGRLYDPQLRPLSAKEIPAAGLRPQDGRISMPPGYGGLRLILEGSGTEDWKLLGLEVFDANTHAPVMGNGYSQGSLGRSTNGFRCHVSTAVGLWHETPVEVVVDLALGPTQVIEFPARTNTFHALPDCALQLLALIPGQARGFSTTWQKGVSTLDLTFAETPDDRPVTSLVFFVRPWAFPLPVLLEVVTADGRVLKGAGSSSSGQVAVMQVAARPEEVAAIRVKYLPNHWRVVFRLPRLPGLPDLNRQARNLFEVKAPFVRFDGSYDMRQWIERTAQVRFRQAVSPVDPGTPLVLSNTTPAEVLRLYESLLPAGTRVSCDASSSTVIIGPSPFTTFWQRWFQWLQRLVRR